MHTELEIIESLHELRTLYRTGELREYDFDLALNRWESMLASFDDYITELDNTAYVPAKEI